jgi:hypothetical protein
MKQSRRTKRKLFVEGIKESLSEFKPLYEKPADRFLDFVKRHPYYSLTGMFLILCLNLSAVIYYSHKPGEKETISTKNAIHLVKKEVTDGVPSIPFSIRNIITVKHIRDSLQYLMAKEKKSHDDTLLFIRLMTRYAKLDTSFNRLINKKMRNEN